jgi:polyisoprenoid-binding protein YceI
VGVLIYRAFLTTAVALCVAGLSSCAQRPPAPRQDSAPAARASLPVAAGAERLFIAADQSEVRIFVYRGGALARLGHNHIVVARQLKGVVWRHAQFDRSSFELTIDVASFEVDDPQLRAAHGEEFASRLSQQQIEGTRRNMLGEKVLHAARIAGTPDAPQVWVFMTIKDVTREVRLPLMLQADEEQWIASGELDLAQSDFGMKPFTAALGALEVQDTLRLEYRIVARRQN